MSHAVFRPHACITYSKPTEQKRELRALEEVTCWSQFVKEIPGLGRTGKCPWNPLAGWAEGEGSVVAEALLFQAPLPPKSPGRQLGEEGGAPGPPWRSSDPPASLRASRPSIPSAHVLPLSFGQETPGQDEYLESLQAQGRGGGRDTPASGPEDRRASALPAELWRPFQESQECFAPPSSPLRSPVHLQTPASLSGQRAWPCLLDGFPWHCGLSPHTDRRPTPLTVLETAVHAPLMAGLLRGQSAT